MGFKGDENNRVKALKVRTDKANANKEKFIKEYTKSYCLMETACFNTGVALRTVYSWIEKDPEFKEQMDFLREVGRQKHIIRLHKALESDVKFENHSLLIFYLKTQCGFIEAKPEQSQDTENINLKITYESAT